MSRLTAAQQKMLTGLRGHPSQGYNIAARWKAQQRTARSLERLGYTRCYRSVAPGDVWVSLILGK